MSLICREEACCIFFCKKYTEENAKIYTGRVDKLEDVEICFTYNRNEPKLICESRIYGAPGLYKLYKSREDLFKEANQQIFFNKSDIKLENDSQIVDFINYLYRPQMEPLSDSLLYKLDYVHDKDILGVIWRYTDKFDKYTPLRFTHWLNGHNIDITLDELQRKVLKRNGDSTKERRRHVNMLDNKYFDDVVNNIVNVIPAHHSLIRQFKTDGNIIIGYCRKSTIPSANRITLLQKMVDLLYKRSLVDRVFVSPCSSAKQALQKRDLADSDILSELDHVEGNTQDFLSFIKNNENICVVAIDYAGFTTNMTDLKHLLREHPNIKKVIVDLFFYENKFKVFDKEQLLNNASDLKLFNCRPASKQRTK